MSRRGRGAADAAGHFARIAHHLFDSLLALLCAMLRSALRSVARRDARSMSMAAVKLPDLPYDFGALQPVISGEIMQACPWWPHPLQRHTY
jgi:hypothetical protein